VRILEILILATVPPTILGFLFQIPSSWTLTLVAVTTALIILHLFIEGYRWQMIPAYVLSTILLLSAVGTIALHLPAPAALWRIVGTILGLFFFIIAVGLPILFPIFRLPAPTGSYLVGTTLFNVLDHTHKEIPAKKPNDNGDIVVQAWYPTDEAIGKSAVYLANRSFPWDWLRLVPTHAALDAPVSSNQASYPVLIFAHGGGFMAVQNTVQMQEFASRGYIVLSISHVTDSAVTVYPDGLTDGRSLAQAWKDMKPVLTDNNNAFKTAAALKHSSGGNRLSMDKEGDQGRDDVIYEQTEATAYSVTIQGANHFNFMDIYLWMPLLNSRYLGSINPQRAVEIVNRYTLAFFEKHLRNQDDFLLDGSSPDYPEVLFNSRDNIHS